jgi:hypothetical protein
MGIFESFSCRGIFFDIVLTKKFPGSKVMSLSNSHSQKLYIDSQAQKRGLTNLRVVTGDVKDYGFPSGRYISANIKLIQFRSSLVD